MYNIFWTKDKAAGFTLIELLVVITIIGILASVVLSSLNDARASARDSVRRSELRQIQLALESYYNKHGTYRVAGSGYYGGGNGWFGYENGGIEYPTAISRVLYNEGFLPQPLVDAPFGSSAVKPEYMMYVCAGGQRYSLSSTLELPTEEDLDNAYNACNGGSELPACSKVPFSSTDGFICNAIVARYGKNYAITEP